MESPRQRIRDLIKKKINIDDSTTEDLEKGIFNWTIDFAEEKKITKN